MGPAVLKCSLFYHMYTVLEDEIKIGLYPYLKINKGIKDLHAIKTNYTCC